MLGGTYPARHLSGSSHRKPSRAVPVGHADIAATASRSRTAGSAAPRWQVRQSDDLEYG